MENSLWLNIKNFIDSENVDCLTYRYRLKFLAFLNTAVNLLKLGVT